MSASRLVFVAKEVPEDGYLAHALRDPKVPTMTVIGRGHRPTSAAAPAL